jgi:HD-like signal output (HDOD) protein
MSEDLFKSKRFKPGPARSVEVAPGSGSRPSLAATTVRIPEHEILAAVELVPPLPEVVNSILTQVGNQHSSAGDLEALIKKDMVIAGRLLKMVNSPFYALSNPVASITQAVTMIGFASLRSLVLAASAANLLVTDLAAYGFTGQGLWKNSIATAALAREIGRRIGMTAQASEEAFVAGLLRDVGKLVLGPLLAKHAIALRRVAGSDDDILARERKALGYDHCWTGDRVAEKWRLPRPIALAIGRHHRSPAGQQSQELARPMAVLLVAERLVYAGLGGVVADHPFDSRLDGTLLKAAGLDGASFQQLVEVVPGIIAAAETSLV